MNWSFLPNFEVVIGLNKIFLGFDRFNLTITHHVSINPLVGEQIVSTVLDMDPSVIRFQRMEQRHLFPCDAANQNIAFLDSILATFFASNLKEGIAEGYTVTHVALQVCQWV